MKKYLCLLLFFVLFLPISVFAEELCENGEVVLKDLVLKKTEGLTEVLEDGEIINNKIKINLKMYEVGDSAVYKFTVENNSNQEFLVDTKTLMNQDPYIVYDLVGQDNSNIVEKKTEKKFTLTVTYQNEAEKTSFKAGKYDASKSFLLELRDPSLINPVTGSIFLSLLLTIILLTVGFLFVQNTKKRALLLLGLFLIPLVTFAYCKYDVDLELNVIIGYVKPNPCTYDGELVQGAEYVDGQYTYRFMQEGNLIYNTSISAYETGWQDMDIDGWGVALTDKDSPNPVTTTLCTSINDKPIVSMQAMFYGSQTSSIDTSSFDTSNVTNMRVMFMNCNQLNEIDVLNFDTSKVELFASLFNGCSKLKDLDLSNFEISQIIYQSNLNGIIGGCTSLEVLNLSNWNFSNIQFGSSMMYYLGVESATSLKHLDLSNVILCDDCNYFFNKANSIEELVLENIDATHVTKMEYMFQNLFRYTTKDVVLDLTDFKINGEIITAITGIFSCVGLNAPNVTIIVPDWNLENLTYSTCIFEEVGQNSTQSVTIDAPNWNLGNSTSIERLFQMAGKNAKKVSINVPNWTMDSITGIRYVFDNVASSSDELKIIANNWTFNSLTATAWMFNCTGSHSKSFDVNIKDWVFPNLTSMYNMFRNVCDNIETTTTHFYFDVSGWDTSSVTNMSNVFYYVMRNVDDVTITGLSDWDVSNVTTMYSMFYSSFSYCNKVSLDLSNWDVSSVDSFSSMFAYNGSETQSLSYGDFSSWNIKSGASMSGMFSYINLANNAVLDIGTINIPASVNINSLFSYVNLKAVVNLRGNPSQYGSAFSGTSTHEGGEVIVNYTSSVTDIDAIIATKSNESNVTKGELITT